MERTTTCLDHNFVFELEAQIQKIWILNRLKHL
jgi:hypothetical protein